jgi:ASPM-SPD-2-Hydin domain-containing protein/HYDIN/CFA65/VesB family protein
VSFSCPAERFALSPCCSVPTGRSSRARGAPVALATLLALVLVALTSSPAHAALSAVGPVDATTSFPSYYQDAKGLRVEPCLDGPPLCSAAASDLVAPDGEAFYNLAGATQTTRNNGKANLTLALEAAYAGGGSGQEVVFSRIRFTDSGGLLPGRTYKVTHPFGVDSFVANAAGAIPKNAGTEDIGALGPCVGPTAHAAGGACDFGEAMTGRLGPFLTWDTFGKAPAQGGPPAGYLGDAATAHAITGSPTGANFFRIEGPSVNPTPTVDRCPSVGGANSDCVETKLFTVEGKVAGPIMASPSTTAFGSQQLGTTSAAKTVTVKNIGAASLTVSSVALDTTGNPEDFAIAAGGTCAAGVTLARDASCTVKVTFAPTATIGTRTATLLVNHDGIRSPERVALRGSAAAVGTAPAVTFSPASLAFAAQRLGTQSTAQAIVITNSGDADLNISTVALTGADASDFSAQNTCVGVAVAPGNTCTIDVLFAPQQVTGPKTAAVQITDDAAGSPRTVALSGTATSGLTAVGAVDPATGFPSTYSDANGVGLQLCLDGPPNCFATPADLVAPDGEAFYNNATAKLTTRNNGKAVMVLALEAAYAGSGTGQEIVFSRIRFSDSGGLVPNSIYTVTHPFGVDTYKSNASGQIPRTAGTQDVGALGPCTTATAHAPGGVCDFAAAMTGRFGPFLRWDPAVAPAPPAGYVGDAATDHPITGSPEGTNFVRIEGPGINPTPTVDRCPTVDGFVADCVETNLFTVEGKLAP